MSFEITALERKFNEITVYYSYSNPLDSVGKGVYPDTLKVPVFTSSEQIIKKIRDKLENKFADAFFGLMIETQKKDLVGNKYKVFPSSSQEASE